MQKIVLYTGPGVRNLQVQSVLKVNADAKKIILRCEYSLSVIEGLYWIERADCSLSLGQGQYVFWSI